MDLAFTTLDVFTTKQLEGNPLAVVQVPASLRDRLTQPVKQRIAREFNLSETVFLHDETSASGPEAREIDIFTINRELPFAGHPTIGTAVFVRHHLGNEGVHSLVTKAGPIGIRPFPSTSSSSSSPSSSSPRDIRADIPHNVHLHAKTLRDVLPSPEDDAGLHANPAIRGAELDAPVFSIVQGMAFVLVRLPSLDLLHEVEHRKLDFAGLAPRLLDEGWRESFISRYYYVDVDVPGEEEEEGAGGAGGDDVRNLRTRNLELGFEDPATGSAASALGAYLTLAQEKKGSRFRVTQGVEMGRKSVISVETTVVDGEAGEAKLKLGHVYLGGTAVVVLQGTLRVEV